MVVPMKGQYEQQCNAAALKSLGVAVIRSLDERHLPQIHEWAKNAQPVAPPVPYVDETEEILLGILSGNQITGLLQSSTYNENQLC